MKIEVLKNTGVCCQVCGDTVADIAKNRLHHPLIISVEGEGGVLTYLCPRHCLELEKVLAERPWLNQSPDEGARKIESYINPLARQFRIKWESETTLNGKPNGGAVERTLRAFGTELMRRMVL